MKPFISQFSHEPIKVDTTSTQDTFRQYTPIGYRITFVLVTRTFQLEGNCEIRQYPLEEKQMQQMVLSQLETELLEASAEGITGII